MTIHDTHPFPTEDDPVRRFRGRLGGTVTLWAAGAGADRVGLTVTSMMVAGGEPASVLALLDPDTDLAVALEPGRSLTVCLLRWEDRGVADAFAGVMPAPGGAFRSGDFVDTDWGPVLAGDRSWVGARVREVTSVGWSALVRADVEQVSPGADESLLVHRRGRYQQAP